MYEAHTIFETPPDDTVIWRYVDMPKLLSLATSKTLYFARLGTFQDPWEAALPTDVHRSIVDGFKGVDVPREMMAEHLEYGRQHLFASCWHMSNEQSASMWSQYSGTAGFAVRTTVGQLKAALIDPMPVFIGAVEYYDYDSPTPDLSVAMNALVAAMRKRKSFRHEEELRAVTWDAYAKPADPSGFALAVDLTKLFGSVFISPESGRWLGEVVRDVFKSLGLGSVPIEHSDLFDPRTY